jgi:hypothetical protein
MYKLPKSYRLTVNRGIAQADGIPYRHFKYRGIPFTPVYTSHHYAHAMYKVFFVNFTALSYRVPKIVDYAFVRVAEVQVQILSEQSL